MAIFSIIYMNKRKKQLAYIGGSMKLAQRNTNMRVPEKMPGNLYGLHIPDNSS